MKLKSAAVLAVMLGAVPGVQAQSSPGNEAYFSLMGDYLVQPDGKHSPSLRSGYGLDLRYGERMDEHWGFEARLFYGNLEFDSAQVGDGYRGGAAGDVVFRFSPLWKLTPILLAGGGVVLADFKQGKAASEGGGMINLGAGLLAGPLVDLFGWPLSARFEIRQSYEHYTSAYYDLRAHFGIEVAMPQLAPPPPPPAPVAVVEPVPVVADEDGDGVPDDRDRCPGSPGGKPVDLDGCPPPPRVITLQGVKFEVDSDELTADSLPLLDQAAATLNAEAPDARVEVAGHTDSSGDDDHNLDLSRRRALAVRDYLIDKGVTADRLSATGYGEGEPVADNDSDEGRRQNRRVELRVTNE